MEGGSEEAKISFLHQWINTEGMKKVESWMAQGILLKQEDFDKLSEEDKKGKYSEDKLELYFTFIENLLAPKSNPLLAVEELYNLKQSSMTMAEFHTQISKMVRRCNFPNKEAGERSIKDVYRGMNSQCVRDKALNLTNNEKGELTIEFLMQHLEIEDSNSHHKSLSQMDSNITVNYTTYHQRQKRGSKHIKNNKHGKPPGQKPGMGAGSIMLQNLQEFLQNWRESVSSVGNINTRMDKSVKHMGKSVRPVAR